MDYSSLDRFIPNRSATMDLGYAQTMICDRGRKEKYPKTDSPYQILLASACLNPINRNRILYFKPTPTAMQVQPLLLSQAAKPRKVRHFPKAPEFILDACDLVDNYYLNLLDWGSSNVLAVALGNQVYLRHAITRSVWQLTNFQQEDQVTSVSWANDGHLIAIGLANSQVELWDIIAGKNLTTLRGCHSSRVGSLAWNENILTTGGMDGCIVNNDIRLNSHIVETYRGHEGEVCGLKWSASGQQLASGGNDNLLYIWDRSVASSQQWLHRCDDHTGDVRALAWCPFQPNLLASGGGDDDTCIKFWNTGTGSCLNSVDTGSQVCGLLWNKNERELLVSQGLPQNQLTLWKYPSMVKIAQLIEPQVHRALYMVQSPDGCTVATAGDESLRLWNIFEPKAKPVRTREPFAHLNLIR